MHYFTTNFLCSLTATKKLILSLLFILGYYTPVIGQGYSYRQYDIKDGLVGNHVYHAAQDKDGFMWFATETGVSRFDGSRFKNFTTADGLPDNEIVRLFADSKGRVWMAPFKNEICYYYKGKIYNATNDSTLKKLHMKFPAREIFEDAEQNIFIVEEQGVSIIYPTKKVVLITHFQNSYVQVNTSGMDAKGRPCILGSVVLNGKSITTQFLIQTHGTPGYALDAPLLTEEPIAVAERKYNYITPYGIIFPNLPFWGKSKPPVLQCLDLLNGNRDTILLPTGVNILSIGNKGELFFNTNNGVKMYSLVHKQFMDTFLTKENVSFAMDDNEGNRWFTTLGRGVYRLLSSKIKKLSFSVEKEQASAINNFKDEIWVGTNTNNVVYQYDARTGQPKGSSTFPLNGDAKVIGIYSNKEACYVLSEKAVFQSSGQGGHFVDLKTNRYAYTYKDMALLADSSLAMATHAGIFTYRFGADDFETVFDKRSTSVCAAHNGLYVGTLYGLHFVRIGQPDQFLGSNNPQFANRITKLLYGGGKLWVGTNDNGLICYDGKQIVKNISVQNGLTGNIIRTMYANGNYLWVGTDRGLNKIDMADTSLPIVRRYTTADGLSSDMINAVCTYQNMVYVATPNGLNFFDETKTEADSRCDLQILGITVSGKDRELDTTGLYLRHRDNNIRFNFVAISFKSAGDITYQYRLLGISDDWKTTQDNFLQYPSLPSGSYELQLVAINKFGVKSNPIRIPFTIAKQLVEETWFRVALVLLAIGLAWALTSWRIRRIRKRYREKIETNARIATLEQQALKAQMNPHFIFNCLNSIQQYVIDKDVLGANKFITGFSRLIRQTLENSSKQLISVGEEEAFLNAYLSLEKLRFEGRFEYQIQVDPQISKEEVFLPPMLLQPYIENSIRHGIRLMQNGGGLVNINISLAINRLICTVVDNGVGREAAQQYKSNQHIEYQSKGMLLTSQRIALFNKNVKEQIILQVEDLRDSDGKPSGTKITLIIPI